jgi:hypothetical protein
MRSRSLVVAASAVLLAACSASGGAATGRAFAVRVADGRLQGVIDDLKGCKRGGIRGAGRVAIVFAATGEVASATVHGPPFEGTDTGACVAGRVSGIHVPPFNGPPFTVDQSFWIE